MTLETKGYGCRCGCASFHEHASGVSIMPSAMPSRSQGARVVETNQRDRALSKDGDAYRRLRKQGLQPPHVDGAAHLEAHADRRCEIDSGHILPASVSKQVETLKADAA